jgi:hypothetical protein
MGEITSALIGITLVLTAVFVPMASSAARRARSIASSRSPSCRRWAFR